MKCFKRPCEGNEVCVCERGQWFLLVCHSQDYKYMYQLHYEYQLRIISF